MFAPQSGGVDGCGGPCPTPACTSRSPPSLPGHLTRRDGHFIIQNYRLSVFFPGLSNYFQTHRFDFNVKEIFSLSQVVFT